MLQSNLCDYSDTYIVVEGTVTVKEDDNRDIKNTSLAFKNNAPFINCIWKINNVLVDNAEDLDIVMPMYNLVEYGKNYRKITASFWNYYKDEPDEPSIHPPPNNHNANSITNSVSFKYKSSITGKALDNDYDNDRNDNTGEKVVEIVVPLKHVLGNFRPTID